MQRNPNTFVLDTPRESSVPIRTVTDRVFVRYRLGRCSTSGRTRGLAAPQLFSRSVTITRGTDCHPCNSRLQKRFALRIAASLDEDVEHDAVLIHGTPKIMPLAARV